VEDAELFMVAIGAGGYGPLYWEHVPNIRISQINGGGRKNGSEVADTGNRLPYIGSRFLV
jgi:hypothetical protein